MVNSEQRKDLLNKFTKYNIDTSAINDILNKKYSPKIEKFLLSFKDSEQIEALFYYYNTAIELYNKNNNTTYKKYFCKSDINSLFSKVNNSSKDNNLSKDIKSSKVDNTTKKSFKIINTPKFIDSERIVSKSPIKTKKELEVVIDDKIPPKVIEKEVYNETPITILREQTIQVVNQMKSIIKIILGLIVVVLLCICYFLYGNEFIVISLILLVIACIILFIILYN